MNHLIRAELLKLRTIRTFWGTVAALLALVPLGVAVPMHAGPGDGGPSLASSEGFRNVIAAPSTSGILMLLVGIMVMAGEFRNNTVTSTFLVMPNRMRVIGAKLAAASIVGIVLGAVALLLDLTIALPWLSSRHVDVAHHVGDIGVVFAGGLALTAIGGLVGVGIGAMLTNQTLAITATLIWTLAIENLLASFVSGIGRWSLGGTASAISGSVPTTGTLLPMWAAAFVFAGYGLVFAATGSRFMLRRDIS
jgi:ABC-2 type transport system permease protein